ncbi:MAG: DUF433 domain-containing protein [Acidimicrobiales bacterium]
MTSLDRITSDPSVCHGKPAVRGLRYPVEMLIDLLASGMTVDEVLADFPDLEREDLLAALEYAAGCEAELVTLATGIRFKRSVDVRRRA